MTTLWCWRCRREVPMLDEEEWPEMEAALRRGLQNVQDARPAPGASIEEALAARFAPAAMRAHYAEALALYERLSGVAETEPERLRHHLSAIYGPPCATCGRPLRRPQAKLCGSCGAPRAAYSPL